MSAVGRLPAAWARWLPHVEDSADWRDLHDFVGRERTQHTIFPPASEAFTAFELLPPGDVRVVVLGQDPYHGPGQAHGLAFSVPPHVRIPPSLRNIFRELHADLGHPIPEHGDLRPWARQGVLLLNTVLTVREGQAHSHRGHGWEWFTGQVLDALSRDPAGKVFVLWGAAAKKLRPRIDETRHRVVAGVHPSPLSAHRGFLGSRPFSAINAALHALDRGTIDWALPATPTPPPA